MTTAVSGLIKIGKTGARNYPERMRFLEANGYYNVAGLRRFFAIELEDYDDKESLLHEIFSKHQVGNSELFALDQDWYVNYYYLLTVQSYIQRQQTRKKNLTRLLQFVSKARYLVFTRRA